MSKSFDDMCKVMGRARDQRRIPGKRIVDFLHEFEVCNGISTKSWSEILRKFLETPEMFTQVDVGDVVDYVQHCNTCTSIAYSLRYVISTSVSSSKR